MKNIRNAMIVKIKKGRLTSYLDALFHKKAKAEGKQTVVYIFQR